jgi:phospholipid/cholesterol/gamma-HCH transport system substrate-binding protein
MSRNLAETLMGAVVLAAAALFLGYAFNTVDIGARSGYTVVADFNKVGGLSVGSDVKMSGIKVGTVVSQALDPNTFLARVTMTIQEDVALPSDTTAAISSEGLLGGNYLELVPGGLPDHIEPGGRIEFTQDPVDIVQLLGKFIFSAGEGAAGASPQ